MNKDSSILWSAIGFFFGSMLLILVASLRSDLAYRATYEDVAHLHIGLSLLLIAGIVITFLSLMGIIVALLRN